MSWYRKFDRHYKYETLEEKTFHTRWVLPESVCTRKQFVHLTASGKLSIKPRYAWDGASGPTFDSPSTMRASLVHDALYQLMREGALDQSYRIPADECLRRIMLGDYKGSWPKWHAFRVELWIRALEKFGGRAARLESS